MSRIGKQPIPIPSGIAVKIDNGVFVAEGPKGRVEQTLFEECPVEITNGEVRVSRRNESGPCRSKHGLLRSLLANAVHGVHAGFVKELQIVGVGYRGEVKDREAHFALGYSHPVIYSIPEGIDIEIDKSNKITIRGSDRQRVGQVAAEIRELRKPDPYKAKGVRYVGERIRRKVGKAGAK